MLPPIPPSSKPRKRLVPKRPKTPLPHPPVRPPAASPNVNLNPTAFPALKAFGSWAEKGAQAEATQELDPIIKNIVDQYGQQAQQTLNGINSWANQRADWLSNEKGIVHNIYATPIGTMNATSEGVKTNIANAGNYAAGNLSGALTQAGLPTGAGGSDINLGQMGGGASEAAYQLGQAMVNMLRQQGSAAEKYAGQLPGFARAEGDYEGNIAQQQIAEAMGKAVADATAQGQQRFYDIYQDEQAREDKNAQAARDATTAQEEARAKAQTAQQAASQKADAATYSRASSIAASRNRYSDHYYEVRPAKGGGYAVVDLGPKSKKAGTAKPTKLSFQTVAGRRVAVNPVTGNVVKDYGPSSAPKTNKPTNLQIKNVGGRDQAIDPRTGKVVVDYGPHQGRAAGGTGAGGKKLPTANQTNSLVDSWYAGKQTTQRVEQPNPDANNNPVYKVQQGPRQGQISYQQAYTRLRAMGYDDKDARGYLDTRWKRGERGRPWVSIAARSALRAAGQIPHARHYKGYVYLDAGQAAALKAAGMLPPGEQNGHRYFIKPGY
jgi:hypothetical protein